MDDVDGSERTALIQRYEAGSAEVRAALDGITSAQLDARPGTGEWSAREVVQHLADSEMISATRLRKLLSEEAVELQGYDEAAYATIFRYAERPIEPALQAFEAARATSAEILRRMQPADCSRAGTHSESGRYTVDDWLRIYAAHAHDHADQIRRARAAVRG
jgi:hypothetical protein